MNEEKTVRAIVKEYLEANGYDGLWNDGGQCACLIDELAPCDHLSLSCVAGYKTDCNDEDCTLCGGTFHVGPKAKSEEE